MKRVNLILLLDTSSSINGKKPGALIDASQNIVQMFISICESTVNLDGYIGAITFGRDISFFPLERAKDFTLVENEFNGTTQMGGMLKTLSEELSSSDVFTSVGDYKNIIVLFSDGGITDFSSDGYLSILRNPAFINSRRIAVAVGNRVNMHILSSFCTLSTDVFKTEDIEDVNDILRYTINTLVSPKPSLKYERHDSGDTEWD